MRIRISALWAAAGPGMAASMDKPLLNDNRAALVTGHRASVRMDRGVSGLCSLSAISLLRHHVGIRRVDYFIGVPMEDDGPNWWGGVAGGMRFSCSSAS